MSRGRWGLEIIELELSSSKRLGFSRDKASQH